MMSLSTSLTLLLRCHRYYDVDNPSTSALHYDVTIPFIIMTSLTPLLWRYLPLVINTSLAPPPPPFPSPPPCYVCAHHVPTLAGFSIMTSLPSSLTCFAYMVLRYIQLNDRNGNGKIRSRTIRYFESRYRRFLPITCSDRVYNYAHNRTPSYCKRPHDTSGGFAVENHSRWNSRYRPCSYLHLNAPRIEYTAIGAAWFSSVSLNRVYHGAVYLPQHPCGKQSSRSRCTVGATPVTAGWT